MIVDYAMNQLQDSNRRMASSKEDLTERVFEAILNMQNNSAKYNEVRKASGGALGQYTTVSKLKDIAILTTDSLKSYLLDTKIANTFQMAGIDFTDHVISFDDLGGVYKSTQDVTLSNEETINYLRAFGDYQAMIGDVIHYYSFKAMSPFFNKILITEEPQEPEQPAEGSDEEPAQ